MNGDCIHCVVCGSCLGPDGNGLCDEHQYDTTTHTTTQHSPVRALRSSTTHTQEDIMSTTKTPDQIVDEALDILEATVTMADGTEMSYAEYSAQHTVDEAAVESIVDEYDAGSADAYRGDDDRRAAEENEAAFQTLATYGVQDDDGWWRPDYVLPFGDLAQQMAEISGKPAADILFKMQDKVITERFSAKSKNRERRDTAQVMGEVSLDLAPTGQYVQDRGHPAAPAVIFMEIDPRSALYQAPEVDADGVVTKAGRTAMAVWFQPEIDPVTKLAVDPSEFKGRYYSNDTFKPGYLGIVSYFPSLQDADDALRELRRAVFHFGKATISARQHDPVGDVYDDPDDTEIREKRAEARRRRTEMAF